MTTNQDEVREFAKEISEKVRHFSGKGQYEDGTSEQKAYLDGVETAIGMMYIDLTGGHKSNGMLSDFIDTLLAKKREEIIEKTEFGVFEDKEEGDIVLSILS